jgi:type I restriction enzyme S subunit
MVVNSMSYAKYERYKDSGVDWLGEIPSDWELGRISAFFSERRQKVSDKDYPALSVTKLGVFPQWENVAKSNDGDNRKLVKKGDFVINSRSDRKGSSGIAKQDGSVSLINIVLKPVNIEPRYSEYLFKSYNFIEEFYRVGHGIVADLWTTRFDDIKNSMIALPTFDEQVKIANFLDQKTAQIDQAIALKQQQIEKLNEYKQIVIQNAVTKGLNPNAPMKDSGVAWIGDIPEHWEVKKIKEIATLKGRIGFRGYNASDLVNEDEGAITISPSNILDDKTFFEKNSYLSWKKYYESPEIMIFNDDILLVKTGSTVGKVGIVKNLNQSATINPQLLVFKKVKVNKDYLFFYLYSDFFFDLIKSNSIGSTIPTISETKIKNLPVVLPPDEEQLNILQKLRIDVDRFDKISKAYQIQIDRLKEYKNILINQAVTGKIKIY